MAVKTTIEIEGLDDLERKLRAYAPMVQGKKGYPQNALRNATRAMSKPVEDSARTIFESHDHPYATGRLVRAIATKIMSVRFRDKATRRGDSVEAYFVGVKAGGSRKDDAGAWYASFIELGTRRMAAKPFLRPALEANANRVVRVFMDKLGADIDKITRLLARSK